MGLIDIILMLFLIVIYAIVLIFLSTSIFIGNAGSGNIYNTLLYRIDPYNEATYSYKNTYKSQMSLLRIMRIVLAWLFILYPILFYLPITDSGMPMFVINSTVRFYFFCALGLLTITVFILSWLRKQNPK
ncbi:MAG: hypothetical protein CVU62_11100 [Deltaproteobacteria bacterium HGW-Deltaproteobacteria-2]|jgi:hypothetical protein|nr:MAG: hypothetical protein CVU62_11100 [Deltaproteobacteria bacterium HGW-Deltaproteobacteria-2]